MAKKYRCYKECFAYNKRFKKGAYFPMEWIESKYTPPPEYFIEADEYEDKTRELVKVAHQVFSAADDPRTSGQLKADLSRFMEVPEDWNRKRIWMALKQREMAESKTDPGPRKPGRPANTKE
jgi:hypothetical protein